MNENPLIILTPVELKLGEDNLRKTVEEILERHGEYGLEDVCLSTLCIIGRDGLRGKLLPTLTPEETALLHKSADSLREVIEGLEI